MQYYRFPTTDLPFQSKLPGVSLAQQQTIQHHLRPLFALALLEGALDLAVGLAPGVLVEASEQALAKIKALFRKAGVRTREALLEAMGRAHSRARLYL